MTKKTHRKVAGGLTLFVFVLAVTTVFGYTFGKDMALRDNAAELQGAE